jgi:hypothetical protein
LLRDSSFMSMIKSKKSLHGRNFALVKSMPSTVLDAPLLWFEIFPENGLTTPGEGKMNMKDVMSE